MLKKTVVLVSALLMIALPVTSAAKKSKGGFKACYSYSCSRAATVKLSRSQWRKVRKFFIPRAKNPAIERQRISKAIGLMETYVGKKTGTSADKGRNRATGEFGQLDCIAESTNTTTYLKLFEKKRWLKWHKVKARAKRRPFIFDTHWSAVIQEKKKGGKLYVVDSWFRDNGKPAHIQLLRDWKSKRNDPKS